MEICEVEKKLRNAILKFQPNCGLGFLVPVVEHCNLNCRSCVHCAPLVKEKFMDIAEYEKDLAQLSELFHGEMNYVLLMGGEPLLHPQINEFMRVTRAAFPTGIIEIVTNGILLPAMGEKFWRTCHSCNVIISPTEYPINFDYNYCSEIASQCNVKYQFYFSGSKRMSKWYPLFPSAVGEARRSAPEHYSRCSMANQCVTLKEGKMYPCTPAAFAYHLKEYFKIDLALSQRDGIDIYSVKTGDELLEKLARPIPFCSFCDIVDQDKAISFEWEISKRNPYEWLGFEFSEFDIQYLKDNNLTIYIFGAGEWGRKAVKKLREAEISVKAVLATRLKGNRNEIEGVPILHIHSCGDVEKDSVCLVAIEKYEMKEEVYPVLSEMGFGDVIPVRINF